MKISFKAALFLFVAASCATVQARADSAALTSTTLVPSLTAPAGTGSLPTQRIVHVSNNPSAQAVADKIGSNLNNDGDEVYHKINTTPSRNLNAWTQRQNALNAEKYDHNSSEMADDTFPAHRTFTRRNIAAPTAAGYNQD